MCLLLSGCASGDVSDESGTATEPSGAAVVSGVGRTEEESGANVPYGEVFSEIKADLTHDGTDETIKIETFAYDETREDAKTKPDGAVIKVYRENEDEPCFISRDFGASHAENGTALLVRRGEGAYLIICDIYEMQGEAYYDYSAVYLNDDGIVEADRAEAEFSVWKDIHNDWDNLTHREDVMPEFKAGLEKWLDGAEILVSFDVDSEESVLIASEDGEIPAERYFDPVWARDW